MSAARSEKNQRILKDFLALPAQDAPEYPGFHARLQAWALDSEQGALPDPSGRSFANWIDHLWNNWAEDPEITVLEVLQGAVSEWCGGRTF